MPIRRPLLRHPDALPLAALLALSLLYWSKVLFTDQVLLPGAALGGFGPFGSQPHAYWNILQWDGLAQYYPWRVFAARQLHQGLIPLWNPYQFAGAPFLANGQSAVFYPLNLVFWLLDPARAFGWSAFLHTFLAAASTYFLTRHWLSSRAAALVAAIGFGFCGYLSAWVMLPTLANTASWLPLALLLLEQCHASEGAPRTRWLIALSAALLCALLAGHVQIFFYLLVALMLRALFLTPPWRAVIVVAEAACCCILGGAMQLLPTLELARLGHRAGQGATSAGWDFLQTRALFSSDWLSLLLPAWPMPWGSANENFGYVGIAASLLAGLGIIGIAIRRKGEANSSGDNRASWFAAALALFGLLYALATPLAALCYFHVPGLAQMGGVGRALVLWSLGIALLAARGLDTLRSYLKSDLVPIVALACITLELFAAGWTLHPIAPRASIYPDTALIGWLQQHTDDGGRVMFITPRKGWLPAEQPSGKGQLLADYHPPGVLPPNGAMVYSLRDVSGYDSLAPRAYRTYLGAAEGEDVSPPLNGNMILLNNPDSPALAELGVRYLVTANAIGSAQWKEAYHADGVIVYERTTPVAAGHAERHFYPGFRKAAQGPDQYDPTIFRCGLFLSLCTLMLASGALITAYSRSGSDLLRTR